MRIHLLVLGEHAKHVDVREDAKVDDIDGADLLSVDVLLIGKNGVQFGEFL